MSNTIKLRRSAVSGAIPTTGQLALGELALNTYDGKLYTKKDDGTATIVEIGASGGGGSTSTVSSTAPSSPSNGDFWYNLNTGIQLVYVDDGNSQQWVDVAAGSSSTLDALTDVDLTSVAPVNGDVIAYNSSTNLWEPTASGGGGGSSTLSGLTDTDLTTNAPAAGDYLAYDGTSWVPVGWGDPVTSGSGVVTGTLSTFPMLGSTTFYANTAAWSAAGWTVIAAASNLDDGVATFNPGATFTGINFLGLGTSSANWFLNSNGGVGFDSGGNSTSNRSGNSLSDASLIDFYVSWWNDDTASNETGYQIYNDGSNDWLVVRSEQKVFYNATTGYVVEAWFRDDGAQVKVLYSAPTGPNYFNVGANRNCIVTNGSDAINASGLSSSHNPFSGLTNQGNYGILVSTAATTVDSGGLLSRLNDVDLTTTAPVNGDVISYNSSSGVWEPVAGGSGLASTSATNIAIAQHTGNEYIESVVGGFAQDIQWNPNGNEFWILNNDPITPGILKYTVSTQWDISTATYNSANTSVAVGADSHFVWGNSGSKLYISTTGSVYEYNASTAYDISTLSLNQNAFFGYLDLIWNTSGTVAIFLGNSSFGTIASYSASTAWDISTLTTLGSSYEIDAFTKFGDLAPTLYSIESNAAGTSLYLKEDGTNRIFELTLASAFDTSNSTYVSPPLKLVPHEQNATLYKGFAVVSGQNKLWAVTSTIYVELDITTTNCEAATAPKVLFNGDVQVNGALSALSGAAFDNILSTYLSAQYRATVYTEGSLHLGTNGEVSTTYQTVGGLATLFSIDSDNWEISGVNGLAFTFDPTNKDLYVEDMARGGNLSTKTHLEYLDSGGTTYTRFQAPSTLTTSTSFTLPDNIHAIRQAMRTTLANADVLEWFSPAALNEPQVFIGGQVGSIVTLTDQANIAMDMALGNNFELTLGGNRTFDNPTNMVPGQVGSIFISQDATGSRTLSWGSYWLFPGGTAPTLSTTALAQDRVDYIVKSSTEIHAQFAGDFQ